MNCERGKLSFISPGLDDIQCNWIFINWVQKPQSTGWVKLAKEPEYCHRTPGVCSASHTMQFTEADKQWNKSHLYLYIYHLISKVTFMAQKTRCNMFTVSWQMNHFPLCSFPWILRTSLPSVLLLWTLASFNPSSSPHLSAQKDFWILNSERREF